MKIKMVAIHKDNVKACIESGVYGCNEGNQCRNLKRLFDLEPGDHLIFYATGISKFAGIFEVTKAFFESKEKIWTDDIYPFRLGIKSVITPEEDQWLDVKSMVNDLDYFQNKVQWSMHFLNNLMPVNEKDYNLIKSKLDKVKQLTKK